MNTKRAVKVEKTRVTMRMHNNVTTDTNQKSRHTQTTKTTVNASVLTSNLTGTKPMHLRMMGVFIILRCIWKHHVAMRCISLM
jgi:hypothetical protein